MMPKIRARPVGILPISDATESGFPLFGRKIAIYLIFGLATVVVLSCWGPPRQSNPTPPTSGGEIPYNPGLYNSDWTRLQFNNCYNYACNHDTFTFAQPGRHPDSHYTPPSGWDTCPWWRWNPQTRKVERGSMNCWKPQDITCENLTQALIADGWVPASCDQACPFSKYKKALVLDPLTDAEKNDIYNDRGQVDFHFYRQNPDGTWSHKPGRSAVTNQTYDGLVMTDPRYANRGNYTVFCGCFCCSTATTRKL